MKRVITLCLPVVLLATTLVKAQEFEMVRDINPSGDSYPGLSES